jgi:two-component system OmpR family sensor kinase
VLAFLRHSLFAKVYLTVIAALAVVALASAGFVGLGNRDMERGWESRRDAFIAAIIPAGDDRQELRAVLHALGRAFEADIAVYDSEGRVIESVGRPLPPDILDGVRRASRRDGRSTPPHVFAARLPDGRFVAARLGRPPFALPDARRNPLAYLALIAGVIGLAAYPVVRHLTRRLENLRGGMAAFGDGELSRRVPVEGRDEVATVAHAFNQAAERIEKLVESNRSLLANASHELRSPLARLRLAIDLVGSDGSERARAEILRNMGELDGLVEEILLASRLDHTEKLEKREALDLLGLVAEEAARHDLAAQGVSAEVRGDPVLLTRLVRNLIQNALRHGAPPVTVDVSRSAGAVVLRVRDHGPGIEAGDRGRVFEPFYRPAGRSESSGGWGLGLSLVRQIAAHHGATVEIEAPDGGGAAFVVRFPAG